MFVAVPAILDFEAGTGYGAEIEVGFETVTVALVEKFVTAVTAVTAKAVETDGTVETVGTVGTVGTVETVETALLVSVMKTSAAAVAEFVASVVVEEYHSFGMKMDPGTSSY